MDAWVGIDVAFAKRKRLPVSVCVWEGNRLIPRPVADRDAPVPPRGQGNAAALDREAVERFAEEQQPTFESLRCTLECRFGALVSMRRAITS